MFSVSFQLHAMLNVNDDCETQLNFNLSSSLSNHILKTSNSNLHCIDSQYLASTKSTNDKSLEQQNLLISFSLNNAAKCNLLPSSNSAEKLSWKFLEQVDSLDNQLRSDEVS